MRNLIFVCMWLMFVIRCQAGIIYVDADANGANDGSNWANACNYLQDALAAASQGDEIRVASGVYRPDEDSVDPNGTGNREETFNLVNAVMIKGGYAGFGEVDPNARNVQAYETKLSGDLNENDVHVHVPEDLLDEPTRAENSYHVVTSTAIDHTGILDGFTITGGNANGRIPPLYRGGGMRNLSGSPTLISCTFTVNSARADGGGIDNYEGGPMILNCTFSENWAEAGGGLKNARSENTTISDCTFIGNSGRKGGGLGNIYSINLKLYSCTFSMNSGYWGAGMHNDDSSLTITECTFTGNLAGWAGGGIYNYFDTIAEVANCTFNGNSAEYGGAIQNVGSNPTLSNCLFSGNSANFGGGISNNNDSCPTFTNCTFSANVAGASGGLLYNYSGSSSFTNCILWANEAPDALQIYLGENTDVTVSYCDIQGSWPGQGNIDAKPYFVQSGQWDANDYWVEGDYHLRRRSPCVDAGDPNYIPEPNETDLDGRPRILDGNDDGTSVVDMGAYEYEYAPPVEVVVKIRPRTLNLASKGKWIMCVIWLPEDYNVADIDPNSVLLEDEVEAERVWLGDEFAGARFSRREVQEMLGEVETPSEVELVVSGELSDGTIFEGTDTIRVIDKGRRINNSPGKAVKRVILKRK